MPLDPSEWTPAREQPTRARFVVAAFLCTMSLVLYLDRVCLSQAVKPIRERFDISNTGMSFVMMAFTLAYGLFEVPTGRWGDRFGSRRVLTRIVVCWSLFTALTGACWGFWSLIAIRLFFGAGEAGAYPNAARIITRWFPPPERGRVQGLLLASGLIGASISPALAAYLIKYFGWRTAFIVFGSFGLVWAAAFFRWFRDDPGSHTSVNDAERRQIGVADAPTLQHGPIPWHDVAQSRCIWLLCLIISCSAFVSYLYLSWYSTYLQDGRHVDPLESGWLTTLVLGGGAIGLLAGGLVADRLGRRPDRVRARSVVCMAAYVASAACLFGATRCASPLASASFTCLSCMAMFIQQPTWWSSATEVSGNHVGALFGLMNGSGVIGAMASQFFFGWFTDMRRESGYVGRDQWEPAIFVCLGLLIVAGACWLFVDPSWQVGQAQPHEEKKQLC